MAFSCSTAVLLGVCDSFCPNLQLSPYGNKIGGYPDFFPGSCTLVSPPLCHCCQSPLFLLVQVYSPLEGSSYHRLLHVFCCTQPGCRNKNESWLVLRSQLRDSSYAANETSTSKDQDQGYHSHHHGGGGVAEWCEEAEDWGSDLEDASTPELKLLIVDSNCLEKEEKTNVSSTNKQTENTPTVATQHQLKDLEEHHNKESSTSFITEQMENLSITTTVTSIKPQYQGPYFPPSYVNVIEESSEDVNTTPSKVEELLKRYQKENMDGLEVGISGKGLKGDRSLATGSCGEQYEKSLAKHGDRMFQKFHKQLSKCPEQILRYSWNGSPLFISDNPTLQPPKVMKCKRCGSTCVFELQLMPSLVYIIQKGIASGDSVSVPPLESECGDDDDVMKSLGVEFGTVLVYTCSNTCWEDDDVGFKEEWAFVQPDPDEKAVCEFLHEVVHK